MPRHLQKQLWGYLLNSENKQNVNLSPLTKIIVEIGPLLLFFAANAYAGIYWATGIFMAASFVALFYSRLKTGRFALMPLIATGFVAVFGLLTIWLHDDIFIKVKVTLVNVLFGLTLLFGILFERPFLKQILGETIQLKDIGWRKLTLRWMVFFFCVAILNEIIWRNFNTDVWVNFKVFGLLPLTFVFAILQFPLMQKHMEPGE